LTTLNKLDNVIDRKVFTCISGGKIDITEGYLGISTVLEKMSMSLYLEIPVVHIVSKFYFVLSKTCPIKW
jgi:hypothetical protein